MTWDAFATLVAAALAALIGLATLIWTIRAWYLSRDHQTALADRQLETQQAISALEQFQERFAYAVSLATSKNREDQFIGLKLLKHLIVAPWATTEDREYARVVASRLAGGDRG
jgi:hypothetical protein